MQTEPKIPLSPIFLNLHMRRIYKAIVTQGYAEFSIVVPTTKKLWLEGKIVVKDGELDFVRLHSECVVMTADKFKAMVNQWYQDYINEAARIHGLKVAS